MTSIQNVSRTSPLQRFREGVDFSCNAVLRNVQEIANAELRPWVLRGIAGAAGAFSDRIGPIGFLGLIYGRKMAEQIDSAQKKFVRKSVSHLNRQLSELGSVATGAIFGTIAATAALAGYAATRALTFALTPEPIQKDDSYPMNPELGHLGIIGFDIITRILTVMEREELPVIIKAGIGVIGGAGTIFAAGALGGPECALGTGLILTSIGMTKLEKYKAPGTDPAAVCNFYKAIIGNYLASIPQDRRESVKEDLKACAPEEINQFSRFIVDDLIRCPDDATKENTPLSLYLKLAEIQRLQSAFRKLQNQNDFSLIQDDLPADVNAASLWRDGRKMAGELLTKDRYFIEEMVLSMDIDNL